MVDTSGNSKDQKSLPIARCSKCEHRIYPEDDYERHSFVGSSGNNEQEFKHKECPNHKMTDVKAVVTSKCLECGVLIDKEQRL